MFDPAGMRVVYGALAVALLLGGCAHVGMTEAQPTASAAAPRLETKPAPVRPVEEDYEILYTKAGLMAALGAVENRSDNHWYCSAADLYSRVVEIAPAGTKLHTAVRESVRLWGNCLAYPDYGRETMAQAIKSLTQQQQQPVHSIAANSPGVPVAASLLSQPLSDMDQKMLEVFSAAIVHQPESAELVSIKYRLARIFYQYNYFDEAAVFFRDVAENHPRSSLALVSAYLVLDCLAAKFYIENRSRAVSQTMVAQVGKFLTLPELTNDSRFVVTLKKIILATHSKP